jgi:hypothetical protein
MRGPFLVVALVGSLLHDAGARAQAGDPLDAPEVPSADQGPAGDPPPPPGPTKPWEAETEARPPAELVEPAKPSTVRRAARPRAAQATHEIGARAAVSGTLAGLAGAGGVLLVGGAVVASMAAVTPLFDDPELRVSAGVPLLLGSALAPFAGGLAAGIALLLIDDPPAHPEEYAELVRTCGMCAVGVTCGVACMAGAVVGSPAVLLSPSCGAPLGQGGWRGQIFSDTEPRREAYLAGAGAAGGAALVGVAALFSVLSQAGESALLLTSGWVLAGAVLGAAVGGGALGALGATLDRRAPRPLE